MNTPPRRLLGLCGHGAVYHVTNGKNRLYLMWDDPHNVATQLWVHPDAEEYVLEAHRLSTGWRIDLPDPLPRRLRINYVIAGCELGYVVEL